MDYDVKNGATLIITNVKKKRRVSYSLNLREGKVHN